MGKPKSNHNRRSEGNSSARLSSTAGPSLLSSSKELSSLSIDQLLEKASAYENTFELPEALSCYNIAVKRLKKPTHQEATDSSDQGPRSITSAPESKYLEVLQSSAYVLLELGRMEAAKKRFTEILSLTNDPSYEIYMYLGQLHSGTQSLAFYRQGIEAITNQTNQSDSTSICQNASPTSASHKSPSVQSLSRAESNAHCAIAELYMTDLCDLPEAESECRKAFEAATRTDPSNPQAWLSTANFYTVVVNTQASRDAIDHCLNLWWNKLESALCEYQNEAETTHKESDTVEATMNTSNGGLNNEETIDLEELTGIPSSGLIALVRMMLELDMDEKAATILESLLEGEEEDNPEVYYLLTVVGRKLWQQENPQLLTYYATKTKVMASKLCDIDLVEEMTLLMSELPQSESTPLEDSLSTYSTSDEDENGVEVADSCDKKDESMTD